MCGDFGEVSAIIDIYVLLILEKHENVKYDEVSLTVCVFCVSQCHVNTQSITPSSQKTHNSIKSVKVKVQLYLNIDNMM
mgnify:CR=1 FL=1